MLHINYNLWIGLALAFGIVDLLIGANFFLIWLAICSTTVAIVTYTYPNISMLTQGIIFVFLAIVTLSYWFDTLRKKQTMFTQSSTINRRADQLIGRTAILQEDLDIEGTSKIKIDDSIWLVKIIDQTNLPKGTAVEIIAVAELTLIVRPTKGQALV